MPHRLLALHAAVAALWLAAFPAAAQVSTYADRSAWSAAVAPEGRALVDFQDVTPSGGTYTALMPATTVHGLTFASGYQYLASFGGGGAPDQLLLSGVSGYTSTTSFAPRTAVAFDWMAFAYSYGNARYTSPARAVLRLFDGRTEVYRTDLVKTESATDLYARHFFGATITGGAFTGFEITPEPVRDAQTQTWTALDDVAVGRVAAGQVVPEPAAWQGLLAGVTVLAASRGVRARLRRVGRRA